MGFQKFTQVSKSYAAKASIRKNGQIGFSQGAIRKFNMDNYGTAVLFYDPDDRRIGVQLSNNPSEEGACKLQVREAKGFKTASISAKAFLEYYSIPYREETVKFDANWDDENKMIIIDLRTEDIEEKTGLAV